MQNLGRGMALQYLEERLVSTLLHELMFIPLDTIITLYAIIFAKVQQGHLFLYLLQVFVGKEVIVSFIVYCQKADVALQSFNLLAFVCVLSFL